MPVIELGCHPDVLRVMPKAGAPCESTAAVAAVDLRNKLFTHNVELAA